MDLIDYCNDNKILLAIFPPHATHTLQPLNVGMFKCHRPSAVGNLITNNTVRRPLYKLS